VWKIIDGKLDNVVLWRTYSHQQDAECSVNHIENRILYAAPEA